MRFLAHKERSKMTDDDEDGDDDAVYLPTDAKRTNFLTYVASTILFILYPLHKL